MHTAIGHLSYCTNIHAGENWESHFEALQHSFPAIKQQVSPDASMGIGLRLSNQASMGILKDGNLEKFQQWLRDNDAYVFTMNGFPYGEFHDTVVKDKVHAPDWTTAFRLEYTIRLFHILATLLPAGIKGGISTSPLSYRHWYKEAGELENAIKIATSNMLQVASELIRMRRTSGVYMHLDIEPEPDGILETGEEFITWYQTVLLPQGRELIALQFGLTAEEAEQLIKDHICLCYDVCHFAIGYEPHARVLGDLEQLGIKVGKIQISAALKSLLPAAPAGRATIMQAFHEFDEPTYLHQVVARNNNGTLTRYPDLPQALANSSDPHAEEWRAHFHVPIFTEELGLLRSTQSDIVTLLGLHKNKPFTDHLEVETYTWGVIPDGQKLPLNDSIVRELSWVKDQL